MKRRLAGTLVLCASLGTVGCEGLLGVDGLQVVADAGGVGGGDTGDGGDGAVGGDSFVGTWTCTGTSSLQISQPPGQAPQSDTATSTYVVAETSPTELTITGRTDAGACAKRYTRAGNTASLEPGQTCTAVIGTTAMTQTFTNGSAILNGDTITTTLSWDFTGTVMSGGKQIAVQGNGSSDGKCTRL